MKLFNYQETQVFLSDYWWFNPQDIEDYEQKYHELATSNSRLNTDPRKAFRDDVNFFAFSSLFGEEFFTYKEALEYCSKEYLKLQNHVDLQQFFKTLRLKEPRLPANPASTYKENWTLWCDFFKIELLIVEPSFYLISELRAKCIEHFDLAPVKTKNLQKFYQTFKHNDPKMPMNPYLFYKRTGEWLSWQDLFGFKTNAWDEYFTTREFCIKKYQEAHAKPTDLAKFYLSLRELHRANVSLPRHPESFYAKTKEWKSFNMLFGLD